MFPVCFTSPTFAADVPSATLRTKQFTLREEIGQGSLARVHHAVCQSTSQHFAVKVVPIPTALSQRVQVLQRVTREATAARVLSELTTPIVGIVRYFACVYDEQKDEVLLVMELCRGPCLAKLLRVHSGVGRLPEAQVRHMVATVARALGHLHNVGLLCVDLKAENIVLDPSVQDKERVMLLDLDLCRDMPGHDRCEGAVSMVLAAAGLLPPGTPGQGSSATPVPGNDCIWGTAEYLAYELLQDGAAAYSPASDWWALGVLTYELLYGKAPWSGPTVDAIFHQMSTRQVAFPGPTAGSPQVSLAMQQFIRSLLRHRPEMRLGSRAGAREVLAHEALRGSATP